MPETPAPAPVPEVPGPFDYVVGACPDCAGKGWRLVTDDGARPACGHCAGLGLVKRPVGQGSQSAAGGRADG